MYNNTPLNIGLFGFGVVGEGIYDVLQKTESLQSQVKKVCIKHPHKKRNAPEQLFTTDYKHLLEDNNINVIVELIDDADEAYTIVKTALQNKKNVVSANKKMIALHLEELIHISQKQNVSFLYEAAVCGSIPIIRNLEEYYDNDWLDGFLGIINGSTNYILTQMRDAHLSFETALQQAQKQGFAESNPTLDVRGIDAAHKLSILLSHIYGQHWNSSELFVKGIQSVHFEDFKFAQEKGLDIKLVAQNNIEDKNITALVCPTFIEPNSPLYHLDNEYNGVLLKSRLSDQQFLYGKGAGRYPTSSAVLSDLSALRYGYKYEYRKAKLNRLYHLDYDKKRKVYLSFDSSLVLKAQSLFDSIDTLHQNAQRSYIIGELNLKKYLKSECYKNDAYSLILFP